MPVLQSTNRVKLSKTREATFGVIPANPVFKAVRETSSSLAANPKTVISSEIRPDRQVTDLVLVDEDAGGDVAGEIAFGVADDDFEEALQGTWANNPAIEVVTQDTEISDVSATTLTVAAGGAAFVAAMLTYMSGFPTPANNRLARVSASTAASIVYPAATFTAETAPIPVGATVRQVGFEGAAGDLAAVTAGGNGLQSTELDFTTLGLSPGSWVKIGDGDNAGHSLATAADNSFCRISAVAAHKLSFAFFVDGIAADPAGEIPEGREFVFLSSVLYAGKIEGEHKSPESRQAPNGVFEAVAALAQMRFPQLDISFSYRESFGGAATSIKDTPAIIIALGSA